MSVLTIQRPNTVLSPEQDRIYERFSREVAAWRLALDEIRALPCAHDGYCSGQLRRTANGVRAVLVCDECGSDVRELSHGKEVIRNATLEGVSLRPQSRE